MAACSAPDTVPPRVPAENPSSVTDLSSLKADLVVQNANTLHIQEPVSPKKGTIVSNRQSSAQMEIISVDMDYQDKNPLFKRNVAQEYQLLRIVIRITGLSEQPFPFDNLNFSLDTPSQKTIVESELGSANEVQDHMVQQVQLTRTKSIQGALYFEVKKGLTTKDIVLSYESLTPEKVSKEYKLEW